MQYLKTYRYTLHNIKLNSAEKIKYLTILYCLSFIVNLYQAVPKK